MKKKLDVQKIAEHIQQYIYDRKCKKYNSTSFNKEEEFKEEPIGRIVYPGNYGNWPEEKLKVRNYRHCNALSWNPNHNYQARGGTTCHNFKKQGFFAKTCKWEPKKPEEIEENNALEYTQESDSDR